MTTENALSIRRRFAADIHRPIYHFLPPSNWMNDPNGLIQWKGHYHLFYQHNPNGPLWGDMHWGHAISDDLIHWMDLPIAIPPTPGTYDESGIFSGCAVNNNGVPTVFYTATRGPHCDIQTQAMAVSHDDLLTWEKYAGNPVVRDMPEVARQKRDFRDPFVWKEGDTWYMLVASRVQDVGGILFLYRSANLTDWEYVGSPLSSDRKDHGVIWECPNLFKFGDEWVLIISIHLGTTTGTVLYFVGSYENFRFTPKNEGVLDYGTLYAPLTFVDDKQRRILLGWLRESRSEREQRGAGWSGVQSIPRVLSVDSKRRLIMSPVPELETIRGQRYHYGPMELTQAQPLDVTGLALDIVAEFDPGSDGTCGIALGCSPDGQERTEIIYNAAHKRLAVHHVAPETYNVRTGTLREIPHPLDEGEPLNLRILFDGSVIEIIANGRTSLTSRIYPLRADSNGVHLLGAKATLRSLDIWKMPSIWE